MSSRWNPRPRPQRLQLAERRAFESGPVQYRRLFASSRVPDEPADRLVVAPAGSSKDAVVFRDGHAYLLPLLDAGGDPVPVAAIEAALFAIEADADARGTNPRPLSVLSTLPRDEWARHHAATREADTTNAATLTAIEGALFGITHDNIVVAPTFLCIGIGGRRRLGRPH